MELTLGQEYEVFRQEVRGFLDKHLPDHLRGQNDGTGFPDREVTLEWQRILHQQGWGVPHWPKEFGGRGFDAFQRLIFEEECARAEAPTPNVQATTLIGPVLNEFGTPEQKARLVPPIVEGRAYWCQGFSEPGSGSDLASLRTKARRDGDDYVICGQKIWTSHAHFADWVFLLVRTSDEARKHDGISMIVVDMRSPGVTVRPIIDISGTHHLNETFYDDVRVPVENLIGAEGQGWSIAKFLLGNERVFGAVKLPGLKKDIARLKKLAARPIGDGTRLVDDEVFLDRLASLEMQVSLIEWLMYRAVSEGGTSTEGWDMASVLKVRASEVYQQVNALLFDALGDRGPLLYSLVPSLEAPPLSDKSMTPDLWRAGSELMFRRAGSIYGGTSEIQRNLISRNILSPR